MSFNLLQTTKELFNNEIITKASALLEENQTAAQKAVNAAIPVVGAALIDKANSPAGAEALLNLIKKEDDNGKFLHNMLAVFEDNGSILENGERLVSNIFGEKANNVANAISQYSGVKITAAFSLLAMIAPVMLGLLARHANEGKINATGFSALMSNQKSWLSVFIPVEFISHFSTLGFNKQRNAVPDTKQVLHEHLAHNKETEVHNTNPRWFLPAIIVLLLAAALWYFLGMKGCSNNAAGKADTSQTVIVITPESTNVASAAKGTVDTLTGDYLYNSGKIITITLPDGTLLNAGEYSTEAKLVSFLLDKNATVDTAKGNWFEFTGVRFKTGGAEISDSSLQQLKNFVAIAKAFPAARFKIGGYTDNTGDSVMNVGLSQKRADAVFARSLALGAAKFSLTGAKGFGPQYPVGDNATVEGRAMNRRVAINVKSK